MTKPPTTPKAAAPKTKAPKSEAAKTGAPKAAASKAGAVKTGASKPEASRTGAAKPAAAKPAAGKKAPKAEAAPKGATVGKPKAGQKPNALQQPLQPSEALAAIVGEGAMPRGEMVSKVWEYIKAHKLQSPKDGRVIVADDKLRRVFGQDQATMFEMNKLLAQHLK